MNSTFLLGRLTPYSNKSYKLVENQNTTDIIKQIIETHNLYKTDYDKIAGYFWKGTTKETCKYLFNFLKNNVKYSIEPDSRQSVKSPAAILATGKFQNGYNDCKHYSLFQAGVYDALCRMGKKIDWCYRFANYKLFSTSPHHVFVVVKINGIEYWCDPVLSTWNNRKPYINKIDKKMSLYSISGIGCDDCENSSYGMSEIGRVKRSQRRSARKAKRQGGEGCTGRTLAKYAPPLIAGRKAFEALIRLNFKKFAVKLHKALNSTQRSALLKKWCGLGGNARVLESAVNKAYAKYKRKHPNAVGYTMGDPASAAIISSATPIIVALIKFLGKGADGEPSTADDVEQPMDSTEQAPDDVSGVGAMNPYLIYGALGLGAIYLLMRKKRK